MGCKCKEKTPEGSQTPCEEANEESYRQAYLRAFQENTKLHAEVTVLRKRVEVTELTAKKYIQRLSAKLEELVGHPIGAKLGDLQVKETSSAG